MGRECQGPKSEKVLGFKICCVTLTPTMSVRNNPDDGEWPVSLESALTIVTQRLCVTWPSFPLSRLVFTYLDRSLQIGVFAILSRSCHPRSGLSRRVLGYDGIRESGVSELGAFVRILRVPAEFHTCISEDGTQLSLYGKNLTSVPNWMESFTGITTLDLSFNDLDELPAWLGKFTALIRLRLNYNQLTELPDSLRGLTALTTLDLGR